MTTEPQPGVVTAPDSARRASRRRLKWSAGAVVAAIVVLAVGGAWWNWARPENSFKRGRLALKSGNRQTVLREARQLIGTPGFEPQGRLLFGLHLVRAGKPVEALSELQVAASGEATAVDAMIAIAQCYYMLGRHVDVIDTAQAALAKDTEALDAHRWLAAAYYDLGAISDAIPELRTIAAKATADPQPDRLLGLICKDNEQFDQAVVHYRESLRRQPDPSIRRTIAVELAESLVKLRRFDEALEALSDCERTARSETLAGECAQGLGRIEEAQDRLQEAINLDPRYLPPILQLAKLHLDQGRADEAVPLLEVAVRQAPNSGLAHYRLSQAYSLQNETDKSIEQLKLFQQTQQLERQFSDLHEDAANKPHDSDVRYQLGVLARQLHNLDLARMWFRASLALEPGHTRARAGLSELDQSVGEH